jgi:hypothetical protein
MLIALNERAWKWLTSFAEMSDRQIGRIFCRNSFVSACEMNDFTFSDEYAVVSADE